MSQRSRVALSAGFHIPDAQGLVGREGDDLLAASLKECPPDCPGVALKLAQFLAAVKVPKAQRPVGAVGNSPLAVRCEDRTARVRVPLQFSQLLAGLCIPQAQDPVEPPG